MSIPVIAIGGAGKTTDFSEVIIRGQASAAAAANIFYFMEHSAVIAKAQMKRDKINVRYESIAQYRDHPFTGHWASSQKKDLDSEEVSFKNFYGGKHMNYCKRQLYPANHPYGLWLDSEGALQRLDSRGKDSPRLV